MIHSKEKFLSNPLLFKKRQKRRGLSYRKLIHQYKVNLERFLGFTSIKSETPNCGKINIVQK
jgi:hypothetical protein